MQALRLANQYRIEKLLHQGKTSSVFLVQDSKNLFWTLKTTKFNSEQQKILMLQELHILSTLTHPNILKIHQYTMTSKGDEIDIVTEFCQQRDIFQYTKKQKKTIREKDLLLIFQQIVHTFIFMNLKRVTHGLLQPSKILVTKTGVIKISDFGCFSKNNSIQNQSSLDLLLRSEQQQHYESYDAPEVIQNEDFGEKADVWAFGIIVYLLQVRKFPFLNAEGNFCLTQMRNQLSQGKLMNLPESSPTKLTRLVQLTLVFNKNERASWRELSLSRIFADKVQNVQDFIEYLLEISKIANYLSKVFWKYRKQYDIKKNKDQVFIYFLTKFQLNSLLCVKKIFNKNEMYRYLFEKHSFYAFKPSEQLQAKVEDLFKQTEKYVALISKTIHAKAVGKLIEGIDIKRVSFFSGLDLAIRSGYQVLKQVNDQFDFRGRKLGISYIPWAPLAKLINFERWLVFEQNPNTQKMMALADQYDPYYKGFVREELCRYEQGMLL